MNQNLLMCFNGEIHAVPIFITIHLKQSWIPYGLTETHFSPNPMDNILLNEMSELTTSSDSWLWLCVEKPSLHLSLKIIIETLESMFQPLWWAVSTEAMLAKDMGLLGLRIKVKQLKKNYSPGDQSRNVLTLICSQAIPLPELNASTFLWFTARADTRGWVTSRLWGCVTGWHICVQLPSAPGWSRVFLITILTIPLKNVMRVITENSLR